MKKALIEFPGYSIEDNGTVTKDSTGRAKLATVIGKSPRVRIQVNGTLALGTVHMMVANYFVPNPNNLQHVLHIDGNKENNHYTNLKWISGVEFREIHSVGKNKPKYNYIPKSILPEFLEFSKTHTIQETADKYDVDFGFVRTKMEDNGIEPTHNQIFGSFKGDIRAIKGWEGFYSISSNGEVISDRYGKTLKQDPSTGYYQVSFSVGSDNDKNKIKRVNVHRILIETFIPNPQCKPCANHKDGNKLNNNLSNLEWVTHQENSDHALELGLMRCKKRMKTDEPKKPVGRPRKEVDTNEVKIKKSVGRPKGSKNKNTKPSKKKIAIAMSKNGYSVKQIAEQLKTTQTKVDKYLA